MNRRLMLLFSEHNGGSECAPGVFKTHHWPEQTNKINRHPTAFTASSTVGMDASFKWFVGSSREHIHLTGFS